jgi:uncharacterized protein (TIGR03437 family)
MRKFQAVFSTLSVSLLAPVVVLAHSYGPMPRVTAAPGDNARACTQCHAGTLNSGSGSVKIMVNGGNYYVPGVKQRITVQVSDPTQQRWGFELSARLNSDPEKGQAGDLLPIDNLTQVICEDYNPKPCANSGVQFIEHTSAGSRIGQKNGATFQFDWIPPATDAGPVTLYVAGNAANGNGTNAGDLIYTSSLQLAPAVPQAPVITGIVSSATQQSGTVAPNSWVTVYGTNLAATTRSFTTDDIIDGGLPFSVDGVSVLLTGAPRLAYIGYVSPTQVNFLMPTDQGNATVQVQVRNSAGISAQMPLVVNTQAPQMLTFDGKYVFAAHADGSLAGKAGVAGQLTTSPVAPGETVTLYGTGLGPANPALVTGQLPTTAIPLATLPAVTIGGASTPVSLGTVVPGAAGLYALKVQVPVTAANGDQAVVVTLGTTNSATTQLTVQR